MTTTTLLDYDIETVTLGQAVQRRDDVDDNGDRVWADNDGRACRNEMSDRVRRHPHSGHGYCSRAAHPEGTRHVALGGGEVCGFWYTATPVEVAPPTLPQEVDDAMAPVPVELSPGDLVRLRSRRALLWVISVRKTKTRSGGDVEVLDLGASPPRVRALARDRLVPRREEDVPTAEQLRQIAAFAMAKRDTTRGIAVQERRNRRFKTDDELNKVLEEMGMEEFAARRSGRGEASFTIEGPKTATLTDAREVLKQALAQLVLPDGWAVNSVNTGLYDFASA